MYFGLFVAYRQKFQDANFRYFHTDLINEKVFS